MFQYVCYPASTLEVFTLRHKRHTDSPSVIRQSVSLLATVQTEETRKSEARYAYQYEYSYEYV